DIQGYELHALRGAQRVLTDNPAIKILFEFWPYGLAQAGTPAEELVSYLEEQGFILKEISTDGLGPIPNVPSHEDRDWYLNLFASR
ncbi:MAG: FkbM family methyltransferase, partial [Chthoniobacterales bacterium]